MAAFSNIYSGCLAAQATGYTRQTDGQGQAPMPTHASRLTVHSHIHCLCTSACLRGCPGTWCWWQTFTLFLQHLQLGFSLILWDLLQELLPWTVARFSLPMYGFGFWEGACNLLVFGLFLSCDLHKQETVHLFVAPFVFSFR